MTASILLRVITVFTTLNIIADSFSKSKPFLKTFFFYFRKIKKFLRNSGLFLKNRRVIIITGFLRKAVYTIL